MDINEIKKMIRSANDRIIIVDETGKPSFVITSYERISEPKQIEREVIEQEVEKEDKRLNIEDLPYL